MKTESHVHQFFQKCLSAMFSLVKKMKVDFTSYFLIEKYGSLSNRNKTPFTYNFVTFDLVYPLPISHNLKITTTCNALYTACPRRNISKLKFVNIRRQRNDETSGLFWKLTHFPKILWFSKLNTTQLHAKYMSTHARKYKLETKFGPILCICFGRLTCF